MKQAAEPWGRFYCSTPRETDKRDLRLISDTRIVGSILQWCAFKTIVKQPSCLRWHGHGMTTPIRVVTLLLVHHIISIALAMLF